MEQQIRAYLDLDDTCSKFRESKIVLYHNMDEPHDKSKDMKVRSVENFLGFF
jgi:hypothetical protein